MDIKCVLGNKIKFTPERYTHIVIRHPELDGKEKEIIYTLGNADFVQESQYDNNVLLYYRKVKNDYFVVVAKVLNSQGFIITAYITNVVKTGVIVWKK